LKSLIKGEIPNVFHDSPLYSEMVSALNILYSDKINNLIQKTRDNYEPRQKVINAILNSDSISEDEDIRLFLIDWWQDIQIPFGIEFLPGTKPSKLSLESVVAYTINGRRKLMITKINRRPLIVERKYAFNPEGYLEKDISFYNDLMSLISSITIGDRIKVFEKETLHEVSITDNEVLRNIFLCYKKVNKVRSDRVKV